MRSGGKAAFFTAALLSAGCVGEGRPLEEYLNDLGSGLPGSGTLPDAGSEVPQVCSARSGTPAMLHFVNASPDAIVFYYWLDWDCREVFYGSLLPGAEADQDTFVGHVWRLRSAETGALLLQHLTASSESVTVGSP